MRRRSAGRASPAGGRRLARRQPATLVVLVLVWVALWGEVTPANVVSGVLVAVVLVRRFPQPGRTGPVPVRPAAALRFLGTFLVALVRTSVGVSRTVLSRRDRIEEGIVAVPLRTTSAGIATVVANAVSLTPDTLTLEVDEDPFVLYVHSLHLRGDPEGVRREVWRFEDLAIAAFARPERTATPAPAPKVGDPTWGS